MAMLVSCPRNTRYFAGGQLAPFQGASEVPISESYGSQLAMRKNSQLAPAQRVATEMAALRLLVAFFTISLVLNSSSF